MILAHPDALPYTTNNGAPLFGTLTPMPLRDFPDFLRQDLPFLLRRTLLGPPSPFTRPLTEALRTFPVPPDAKPLSREDPLLHHPDPIYITLLRQAVTALPSRFPPEHINAAQKQSTPNRWTPYCLTPPVGPKNRNSRKQPTANWLVWMVPYDANLPTGDLPLPPRAGPPVFDWKSLICFTVAQTKWAQHPPTTNGLTNICLPPHEPQPSVATSYALLTGAYNQLLAANAFEATIKGKDTAHTSIDLAIIRLVFTDKSVALALTHSLRPDNLASIPYPDDPLTITGLASARIIALLALFAHDNPSQRYCHGIPPEHRNFPWPIPLLQPRALPAPSMPAPPPPPPPPLQEPQGPPPPPFQSQRHSVPQERSAPLLQAIPPPKHSPPMRPDQFCGNCFVFGKHWAADCTSPAVSCPTDFREQRRMQQDKARLEGQPPPRRQPKRRKKNDNVEKPPH
ncbi:hypothetical protein T484DRAFT_2021759 [Baffinella frigidus]|nr:hypothetical protein T484DRAFT_2021759 [Cryptophyta sp. CCMP2293]